MRICTFAPAIVALVVILCAPFSFTPNCGPVPHGGLICYCCAGKNCIMVSCPKCSVDSALDDFGSSLEIILESSDQSIFLQPSYSESDTFYPPGTVYIEVPVRPPKTT